MGIVASSGLLLVSRLYCLSSSELCCCLSELSELKLEGKVPALGLRVDELLVVVLLFVLYRPIASARVISATGRGVSILAWLG